MPRSPLLHLLRRSARVCRRSARTGVPIDELIDPAFTARCGADAPTPGLSRRAFLATAGAGALALGGCRTLPVQPRGREAQVIVVGAGLAGLTVGYRLHRAGVPVRLLDAQPRVGGRCYSLRGRFPDDQVVELGGELVDSPHRAVRALCDEFGIELDDLLGTEDPALDKAVWHFDGQHRTEREICEAFAPLAARLTDDLRGLPRDATYRDPGGLETLDRLSIDSWLTRAGADGWFGRLLDIAYTTEYGLEVHQQSSLNLLSLIRPSCPPFDVFGDSDERFHVRGGNDRMVSALAGPLEGAIEPDTRLEAVTRRADGHVELTVRRGSRSRTLAAPHVVLAIPFTLLRDVRIDLDLPPAKRNAIDRLGYGTNAKLMVGFESRPWRTVSRSAGEAFSDAGFQCVWETSRAQAGAAGVLTNFTGGFHGVNLGEGDAPAQAERLVSRLERVFPGVTAARGGAPAVRFHWPSHPWTRGSYACYRPGQRTTLRGAEGERVGNVHFAGEHCSMEFQGYMEGAVETGEAVAATLLAELGAAAPVRQTA